jgi:pyruvate/2-oxoglutarate/acetoin dehydrogenase E1 component
MKSDPAICIFGEGVHMKVHFDAPYIEKEFPDRVVTLPISEDGNTNFGVGASLVGVKPIIDVVSSDFLFRTMDSIGNTAAKLNYVSGRIGRPKTIIIRSEFLFGGPTSGQRLESQFARIPGLNVVLPSNPRDAQGLMNTVLKSDGVTLFFEDRMISDSDTKESDTIQDVAEDIPVGKAKVRRRGNSLTVVSYAISLKEAEAEIEANGFDCDLIDLRSLYPLDYDAIRESVSATGKLLIIEPDVAFEGIGAEIGAHVAEHCLSALRRPIKRLGAPRSVIPVGLDMHKYMLPLKSEISDAIKEMLS